MKRLTSIASLSLLLLAGCSAQPTTPAAETVGDVITVSGKIVALDQPARELTVEGPDGRRVQLHAGDEVRNFNKIHVGDSLEVDYLEAVTVSLEPAGSDEPGAYRKEDGAVAKRGQKPGVAASDVVTIVAPVIAVDPAHNTLTVRGPEGRAVKLAVREPEHQAKLGQVKVGELLKVVFTDAAAVAIRPKNA